VVLESIAAFYELVGYTADVGLTITSHFEEEVTAHLEPALAAAFIQDGGRSGSSRQLRGRRLPAASRDSR
jgi:hypothetical protein